MNKLFAIVLIWGFFFTVHNNSSETQNCFLYWINHPFGFKSPANVHGGEYDPDEELTLYMEYHPGRYEVIWTIPRGEIKTAYGFIVGETVKRVFVTPEGATME